MEVIKNEPFEDDKMGKGQLTHKIYHLARLLFMMVVLSTSDISISFSIMGESGSDPTDSGVPRTKLFFTVV